MLGLDAGALAVDLGPGIRVVELDVLDVAAGHDVGLALAALLHAFENLVLDLEIPGVVELTRLDDGACGRDRVASALHLDCVEEGAIRQVIAREELALDHVAGFEVDEPIGSGADRLEIRRRLARLAASEAVVEMLGDDHPAHADEGISPERRGLFEVDLDGVAVDLLDLHVLVGANGHGRGGRVGRVLPVEDDVIGGERLTVVPLDALLELPGHRLAVLGDAAVLHARDLRGQVGDEVAVRIP